MPLTLPVWSVRPQGSQINSEVKIGTESWSRASGVAKIGGRRISAVGDQNVLWGEMSPITGEADGRKNREWR